MADRRMTVRTPEMKTVRWPGVILFLGCGSRNFLSVFVFRCRFKWVEIDRFNRYRGLLAHGVKSIIGIETRLVQRIFAMLPSFRTQWLT